MALNRDRVAGGVSTRGSQQQLSPLSGSTSPATGRSTSHPTTPPPLSRGDMADLAERRRGASRRLEFAEAQREREQGRLEQDFERFRESLDSDVHRRRRSAAEQMGARGLAMQPRGMGRQLRTIRDWHQEQLAEAESTLADRMAALEEAVEQARFEREMEHGMIEADRARRQSELDRLLTPSGVW